MKKIFVTRNIMNDGFKLLRDSGYQVDVWMDKTPPTKQQIIERANDAAAIISMLSDKIDQELIDALPNLKVIANYAVGFNNIDVSHATSKKIAVGNTPGILTDATADIAFALLINVARLISVSSDYVKQDRWYGWEPQLFLGKSLVGKTLGIVGMGRIGFAMAKRAALGFDMKVIYTASSAKKDADQNLNAQHVSFEELLKQSDFISVHTPLTDKTRGMFNHDAFQQMKNGAIFINTARGEIHDQDALYQALKANKLFGAGLDVTNPEPMRAHDKLLTLPNVIVTPHYGSADFETRAQMSIMCAQNILLGLENKPLIGFVNRDHF